LVFVAGLVLFDPADNGFFSFLGLFGVCCGAGMVWKGLSASAVGQGKRSGNA
jgi:hypothetical protein